MERPNGKGELYTVVHQEGPKAPTQILFLGEFFTLRSFRTLPNRIRLTIGAFHVCVEPLQTSGEASHSNYFHRWPESTRVGQIQFAD